MLFDLTDGKTVPQANLNVFLELFGPAQRDQNAERHQASLLPVEAWTGPDASEHEIDRKGHHRRAEAAGVNFVAHFRSALRTAYFGEGSRPRSVRSPIVFSSRRFNGPTGWHRHRLAAACRHAPVQRRAP